MRPGLRLSGAVCAAAILTFTTAMPPEPATAQGLFDFLFNAFRRPPPSHTDPNARPNARDDQPEQPARRSRGGLSYCVRLCDGRHFPINYRRGAEAVEICSALCPAASTKVFSGSTIDTAVASDGRSYKDLPAAFTYRSEVVSGCTCNGKDAFGLAQIEAEKDPTLQPGDIVATSQGFVVAGRTRQAINFSPLRGEMRSKLFAVKIAPGRGTTKSTRRGDIRIRAGTWQPPRDENQPDTAGRIVRSVGPAPFPVGAAATDGRGRREGPDDEP